MPACGVSFRIPFTTEHNPFLLKGQALPKRPPVDCLVLTQSRNHGARIAGTLTLCRQWVSATPLKIASTFLSDSATFCVHQRTSNSGIRQSTCSATLCSECGNLAAVRCPFQPCCALPICRHLVVIEIARSWALLSPVVTYHSDWAWHVPSFHTS